VKDEDPSVLEASARALGQIGGPDAQRALGDILLGSSTSDDARRMAADVLDDMGGDGAARYKDQIQKFKSDQSDSSSSDDSSSDTSADIDVE